MTAQRELRDLIAERIGSRLNEGRTVPSSADLAEAVAGLFHEVRDEREAIDTSRLCDPPGSRCLEQRWLVARVPRGSWERITEPDRPA